jgi:hypothetical protein
MHAISSSKNIKINMFGFIHYRNRQVNVFEEDTSSCPQACEILAHSSWQPVKFCLFLPYISLAQRSTKLSPEQYVPTRLTTPTDRQGYFRGQLYTRNSMNGNPDENLLVSHVSFRFVYAAFRVSACTVRLHVNMKFTSVAYTVQAIPVLRLKCVFKSLVESNVNFP